jgi:hypothetical protein
MGIYPAEKGYVNTGAELVSNRRNYNCPDILVIFDLILHQGHFGPHLIIQAV